MKTWLSRSITALLCLAALGGLVYAFLPQAVEVEFAAVSTGPLVVTVEEDGKTRIRQRYAVSAPLGGKLQRIELKAGAEVIAGETLLAVVEPTPPAFLDARELAQSEARVKAAEANLRQSEASYDRAVAALKFAQTDLQRARELTQKRVGTGSELDEKQMLQAMRSEELRMAESAREVSKFELAVAQAALLRARSPGDADLGSFEIRSPISGRVLKVSQESATVVTPGTALLEVGDPTDLEVEIDVLSIDAVKIQPGDRAFLEQWGGTQPLQARVRVVEPAAFTKVSALGVEEQRVNVILDLVDPPEVRPTLGDQYRVEAKIVTWETANTVQVPTSALFRDGNSWSVFRMERGIARKIAVDVGHQNGLFAEILTGLTPGETVVVHPSDRIRDGVQVIKRR